METAENAQLPETRKAVMLTKKYGDAFSEYVMDWTQALTHVYFSARQGVCPIRYAHTC